jgi:predicted GIY-YIG superfamily endonuclease
MAEIGDDDDDIKEISEDELRALSQEKNAEWVVYILRSVPRPMRTYAGVSNHIIRRLRQHNGEIVGGSRATKTTRPWRLHALVYGFGQDKKRAMRFEWFTKVKNYNRSFGSTPGNDGIARREFLVRHAMQKCRTDGDCALGLHVRVLPRVRGASANVTLAVPKNNDTIAVVV